MDIPRAEETRKRQMELHFAAEMQEIEYQIRSVAIAIQRASTWNKNFIDVEELHPKVETMLTSLGYQVRQTKVMSNRGIVRWTVSW